MQPMRYSLYVSNEKAFGVLMISTLFLSGWRHASDAGDRGWTRQDCADAPGRKRKRRFQKQGNIVVC